jgi:hypothetical protein
MPLRVEYRPESLPTGRQAGVGQLMGIKTSPFQSFTIVVMTFSTGLQLVLTNVGL